MTRTFMLKFVGGFGFCASAFGLYFCATSVYTKWTTGFPPSVESIRAFDFVYWALWSPTTLLDALCLIVCIRLWQSKPGSGQHLALISIAMVLLMMTVLAFWCLRVDVSRAVVAASGITTGGLMPNLASLFFLWGPILARRALR